MDDQVLLQPLQVTARHDDIGGPVGSKQHQPGADAPAGERREQVEGGFVGQLEIFENQNQRLIRREELQGFADLSKHAFAGGAQNLAAQQFALLLTHEIGELHQPGGCVGGKDSASARHRPDRA